VGSSITGALTGHPDALTIGYAPTTAPKPTQTEIRCAIPRRRKNSRFRESRQATGAILDNMTALPDWMRPPREEGWYSEDLDMLVEAPRHTELIDGVLVFNMSPQRRWHSRLVTALTNALTAQAPEGFEVDRELTVVLDRRNRPEPDVLVSTARISDQASFYDADSVVLVVEVVSPESEHRDRAVKPQKYAEAGIAHYWRIENEDGAPAIHVYERDVLTHAYVATGIFRDRLDVPLPYPVKIDLTDLLR
jgi:Uma2 family endonuclease